MIRKLVGSFFNRHAVIGRGRLPLFVSMWFQVYFNALIGLIFTFPSWYLFTIDHKKYLVLEHSRPRFTRDFTSPALLVNNSHRAIFFFIYWTFTVFGWSFQTILLKNIISSLSILIRGITKSSRNTIPHIGPNALSTIHNLNLRQNLPKYSM